MLDETAASGVGTAPPVIEGPLEGTLEGTTIAELLWRLGARRFTGSLVLEHGGTRKVVYLRDGLIVFAASTDPEDRLGPFLLRRGDVRLSDLVEAGSRVATGRRLGQILIERGALEPPAVVRAVAEQVREIALSLFGWREGSWRVSPVRLPEEEPITLDLAVTEAILEGVRRIEAWEEIRRAVGGPRAIYRVRPGVEVEHPAFGLVERSVLERLGTPQRMDALCREIYAPSFAVFRTVWALSILGFVERWSLGPIRECLSEPGEGVIGEDGIADLVVELGERGFGGVLRLFRDREEGALFFEDGRVEFATTSDPEQGLSGHLLRRGVISEKDHELAVRRLISGKRLGRLLVEYGALDDEDVERFVREQVLDVARRLVLWSGGEYLMEEALPSDEEITLSMSAEDVVMTACESVDRFRPVWEALGGLDAVYRLRPDYLDRLDRMSLRPEAWGIVALLGRERSLREILEARAEPDFEICRRLYGLLRARVVERVAATEAADVPGTEVFEAREPGTTPGAAVPERAPGRDDQAPDEAPARAAELAPELFSRADEARRPPVVLPAADAVDAGTGETTERPADRPAWEPPAVLDAEEGVSIQEDGLPDSACDPGAGAADAPAVTETEKSETADDDEEPTWVLDRPDETGPSAGDPDEAPEDGGAADVEPVGADDEAGDVQPVGADGGGDEVPPPAIDGNDPGSTLELPRSAAEAAAGPARPLAEEVARFNQRHAVLFRELRLRVGAGTANFVRACRRSLGTASKLFDGLEPDASGRFDASELERRLAEGGWENPANLLLGALIDEELATVRHLLERNEVEAIERALRELEEPED